MICNKATKVKVLTAHARPSSVIYQLSSLSSILSTKNVMMEDRS